MNDDALLQISQLHAAVLDRGLATPVLRGVDLAVRRGSIHGLVGESGGGKTMVGRAVLDLLPDAVRITGGSIRYDGRELVGAAPRERRRLLGREISLILQNPMTALNPAFRIGAQMIDVLRLHLKMSRRQALLRTLQLLRQVQIREPERVIWLYPHELSGGMCQRVLIAIAFSCEPKLIIADEPTTALDVTVQQEVLRLLKGMQRRLGTTVLFITHDLGVVAKLCDDVSVIFAGRILETGTVADVFAQPKHPYTTALLDAVPRYDRPDRALHPIPTSLHEQLWQQAWQYDAR
jgi:peptide/nickel transport system ATP-binding protein